MEQTLILIRIFYLGIGIGGLAFFLLWESGNPKTPFNSRQERKRHVVRNLTIFAWVIFIADYVVGQWLLGAESLLTSPPQVFLHGAALPLPMQITIAFLLSDLLGYGIHRAAHRYAWFWRLHAVHHSDPHVDTTTAARTHPLEISIAVAAKIALYSLLGLPLWIEGLKAILHNFVSMVQHANVKFPAQVEFLRPIFVTPRMHQVHHDTDATFHNRNFGVIFSFWDRLFGTHLAPDHIEQRQLGLDGYWDERWQTVRGMLLGPFGRQPDAIEIGKQNERQVSAENRSLQDHPESRGPV